MSSPYTDLPDHHFWRRSISTVETHLFDPVIATRFRIARGDRVATAGSCFAQHIARRLQSVGDNYYTVETGESIPPDERARRQYGLFSARYGNIYTTAQLWQLHQEAYGLRTPLEKAWQGRSGGWIDPFRPSVEPDGFSDPGAVAADRAIHLAAVRRLFETCDILVFTLGLTECWRSKEDGSVFPLAPGVAGGEFDPARHEFANLGIAETIEPLKDFLEAVRARNPDLRVILTVSPVPLAATYENRNVMVSTTYSKAVLRVAVEEIMQRYAWVDYFPSYEIITGPMSKGYYADDLREVTNLGVAHVMRTFERHYLADCESVTLPLTKLSGLQDAGTKGVICDEALLEAIRDKI